MWYISPLQELILNGSSHSIMNLYEEEGVCVCIWQCAGAQRAGGALAAQEAEPWEIRRQKSKRFPRLTHAHVSHSRMPSPMRQFTSSSRPCSLSQQEARTLNLLPGQWIISFNHRRGSRGRIFSPIAPFPLHGDGSLPTARICFQPTRYKRAGNFSCIIISAHPHALGFLIKIIH